MATAVNTEASCKNFINGRWIESRSGRVAERRNPADQSEVVAVSPLSTREEVREAIAAARAAFPAWRDTPAPARGKIVARAAAILDRQKEEVARLLTREEGKIYKDSLAEVMRSVTILEFMAGEATRMGGETAPSQNPRNFAYTFKQPLGVVASVTPWNFPIAIPVWKAAPAIVTGNTVVFKPAGITPLTGAKVVEIFAEAGVPAGVSEYGSRLRLRSRRRTHQSSRRQGRLLHRLERRRQPPLRQRRRQNEEVPVRNGRQKSRRHSRRRRSPRSPWNP